MKTKHLHPILALVVFSVCLMSSNCSKDEPGDETLKYSIGGTVSGLTGSGLILQNNESDNLSITENGEFTFPAELADSAEYAVSILSYPEGQSCYVGNGSGTVDGADVTDIQVICSAANVEGCTSGSIVYLHDLANDYEGFHQEIGVVGTVPFTCNEDGTMSGSGILSITVNGTIISGCLVSEFSGDADMFVVVEGTYGVSELEFEVVETWYLGSPMASGTATDICDEDVQPFNYPLIEATVNYTQSFPNISGYTKVQPYGGAAGSGSYSWTIYID